eukprot:3598317-Lingulodinium_polyedra.AAC.1
MAVHLAQRWSSMTRCDSMACALSTSGKRGPGHRQVGGDTPHRPTQVAPRHTSGPDPLSQLNRPPPPRAA